MSYGYSLFPAYGEKLKYFLRVELLHIQREVLKEKYQGEVLRGSTKGKERYYLTNQRFIPD